MGCQAKVLSNTQAVFCLFMYFKCFSKSLLSSYLALYTPSTLCPLALVKVFASHSKNYPSTDAIEQTSFVEIGVGFSNCAWQSGYSSGLGISEFPNQQTAGSMQGCSWTLQKMFTKIDELTQAYDSKTRFVGKDPKRGKYLSGFRAKSPPFLFPPGYLGWLPFQFAGL